jgi:hypothetical protein
MLALAAPLLMSRTSACRGAPATISANITSGGHAMNAAGAAAQGAAASWVLPAATGSSATVAGAPTVAVALHDCAPGCLVDDSNRAAASWRTRSRWQALAAASRLASSFVGFRRLRARHSAPAAVP